MVFFFFFFEGATEYSIIYKCKFYDFHLLIVNEYENSLFSIRHQLLLRLLVQEPLDKFI
jgi:hypothetical protein